MSAMNILIQSDRVHLFTDGAAYHPDGELVMVGPKAVAFPHLNCAMAMRGPASGRPIFGEFLGNSVASFDELRGSIGDLLRQAAVIYAPVFQSCLTGPEFEIVIAGISETRGPCAYLVPSHDRYGEPWRLIELNGFIPLPNDEAILAEVQAAIPPGTSPDDIDAIRDGLAVMEIQRHHPRLSNGDDCYIGGFAQITTVTADSVTSRIIHRWPDVVGERLAA